MEDLSALLTSARSLNAHFARPDQPIIARSIEQIESDSRNLLARLPGLEQDGRATYLLARANVDAIGLGKEIAGIDSANTFQPLQPLGDHDVQGYLRHIHEQTLVSTIEETRKDTQEEFYRVMEERIRRDWQIQKRKIFDELGVRTLAMTDSVTSDHLRKSVRSLTTPRASLLLPSSLEIRAKTHAYAQVVHEMNAARRKGLPFPIAHAMIKAAENNMHGDFSQCVELFHFLAKIVDEPKSLPLPEQTLNNPSLERQFARAYNGNVNTKDASSLRRQIVRGSKKALEDQYKTVVEKSLLANPLQAQLGGDPSYVNRIRAFVSLRYYRSGRWDDRIELIRGQPEWARLFFLLRTGHTKEAIEHAESIAAVLNQKDSGFVSLFKAWVESGCQKLPSKHRDRLQSSYNAHLLYSPGTDPFKLALYKLMGRLDANKRSVPYATGTTEDWMWFQLAMLDNGEEITSDLKSLADALINYGREHFDGPQGQANSRKGSWSRVLLLCGMFEHAVVALYHHSELQLEAIHLAIALAYYGLLKIPTRSESSDVDMLTQSFDSRATLNLGLMISRYIRTFMRSEPNEAMQYVYTLSLVESQSTQVGKEQKELALDLGKRIITTADSISERDRLIGGFTENRTKYVGEIEKNLALLGLKSEQQYDELMVLPAAKFCEREGRINDAITLYNLAGAFSAVMSCIARGLGDFISRQGEAKDDIRSLKTTARDILRHYSKLNKVAGGERDIVIRLLGVHDAIEAKNAGRLEAALEALEATEIIPMDSDAASVTSRAAEFRDQDDVIARNLTVILPLAIDILEGIVHKAKGGMYNETSKQRIIHSIRQKARAVMIFAGTLRYRLSPEVHSYLSRVDVSIAL